MTGSSNKTTVSSAKRDARLLPDFSDDDMEVYAEFVPATGKGTPLTVEYVEKLLSRLNVNYGIIKENIKYAIEQCNKTGKNIKKVLIAKGDIPINEINEYFILEESVKKPVIPRFEDGAKTDYKAFSQFIIVNSEQVLAIRHAPVTGIDGKNIHGVNVPFLKTFYASVNAGKNTKIDGDTIISACAGHLVISGNTLNVEPVLTVRGAIGYATGDINFPGDVAMDGQVNDGFKLNVGGNITVKETLDVTDIVVKNNLTVKGGMIGRGRALIKVSGNINSRFIQNCRIACKESVNVITEMINTTLYTMDSLIISEKGTILGGEIYAFHNVSAGRIGKDLANPVKIYVGTNWTLRQEIEKTLNYERLLVAKQEKITGYLEYGAITPEQLLKIKEMKIKIEMELSKCIEKKKDYEKHYVIDRDAYVVCFGSIAPKTIIEICGIEFTTENNIHHVRIALDKTTGMPTIMPIK